MILIALNLNARENYAFYDPSAPIELTLSNPRGYAPRITDSILRGLRGKTLIDVENKIDLEKGTLKEEKVEVQEKKAEEITLVREAADTVAQKPKRKTKR